MLHVLLDKAVTALNANATEAYPAHTLLLHFTKHFRRLLIKHGYAIVDLLLVSLSESVEESRDDGAAVDCDGNFGQIIIPLTDDHYQTAKKYGREVKIEICSTAMDRALEPFSTVFVNIFTVS